PDGDPLTVAAVGAPLNGTAVLEGEEVRYTPEAGFVGTDAFTYVVTDGRGGIDEATVTVAVNAEPNQPPVANDDTAATEEGASVLIDVLANDTDAGGARLSIASITQPDSGTATEGGGRGRFSPAPGFSGEVSLLCVAADGRGGTDTAEVTVTVD